jgi:protein tyrosine phosphatase
MISDDSSRVKLKEITEEDGSDYINASHLDVKKSNSTCYTNLSLPSSFRVTTSPRPTLVLKVSAKC